ncbi:hypothetical protein AB0J80_19835 [Actinoplanes sp. NPDC049548]|uniref:hypothetical protein n=1 Tax=Actinoplanes sp. NPDC049548 TaxID=3155152 RepID=UPI00343488AF
MNIDEVLRAAAEPVPARVAQPPAQALLDRIVAAPPQHAPADTAARRAARPATRILTRPRAVFAALAAAAAAVAALTVPHLGDRAAYASWTPQPSPLAAADLDGLADRCVAQVNTEYGYPEADPAGRVVHGEKRGDYASVSVVTPAWTALCFRDHDGAMRDASFMADPVTAAALGATGVEMQSWPQLRTQEGDCRLIAGHVGSQVVGVDITVRAAAGDHSRTVHATVEDGYFLAWYPEPAGDTDTTTLTLRLAGGGTVADLSARDLYEAPRTN